MKATVTRKFTVIFVPCPCVCKHYVIPLSYFDIFEIGVEVYHSLLMEDVLELCDGHPVNEESGKIDYQMIALAYRLTTFDHDSEWRDYLPIE